MRSSRRRSRSPARTFGSEPPSTPLRRTGGGVRFSDGSSGAYDLVVGADGIHSKVRSLVFPGAPEPEYTGQIVWRYNVPRPEGLDTLDMFVGANGKAGFVPLAPDMMYILYIEAVPADEVKMPDDRLAEIFRERLAEFGGQVAEIRDTYITDSSMVVVRPVESLLVPPRGTAGGSC